MEIFPPMYVKQRKRIQPIGIKFLGGMKTLEGKIGISSVNYRRECRYLDRCQWRMWMK